MDLALTIINNIGIFFLILFLCVVVVATYRAHKDLKKKDSGTNAKVKINETVIAVKKRETQNKKEVS